MICSVIYARTIRINGRKKKHYAEFTEIKRNRCLYNYIVRSLRYNMWPISCRGLKEEGDGKLYGNKKLLDRGKKKNKKKKNTFYRCLYVIIYNTRTYI